MGRRIDPYSRALINFIKKKKGASFEELLEFVAKDKRFHKIVKSVCGDTDSLRANNDYNCLKILRDWVNRRLSRLEKQGYLLTINESDKSRKFLIWPLYLEDSLKESLEELKGDLHFVLNNSKENLNPFDLRFSYFLFKPMEKLLETIYEWGYNRSLDTLTLGRIIKEVSNKYGLSAIEEVYGPFISFLYEEITQRTEGIHKVFDAVRVDPFSPFSKTITELEKKQNEFIEFLHSKIQGNQFNWDSSDIDIIKEFLDSFTRPYSISRLAEVKISDCKKYKLSYSITICLSKTKIKYLDGRIGNPLIITPKRVNKSYTYKLINRVREFVRFVFRNDGNYVEMIATKKLPILTEKEFTHILTRIVSKHNIVNHKSKTRKKPIIIKIIYAKGRIKDKLKKLEENKIIKLVSIEAKNLDKAELNIDTNNEGDDPPIVFLVESPESLTITKQNILIRKLIKVMIKEDLPINTVILEVKDPFKLPYTYRKPDLIYVVQ